MKKLTVFLLGGVLLFGGVACDVARTSGDAPNSLDGEVENPHKVGEALEDADDNIRQAQLNADIRAREERNQWIGDPEVRADSDLESEVRAKLEKRSTNIC